MLFDLEFTVEVRNAGVLIGAGYRAVYEMTDARLPCRLGHALALPHFRFGVFRSLHRVHAVHVLHGVYQDP